MAEATEHDAQGDTTPHDTETDAAAAPAHAAPTRVLLVRHAVTAHTGGKLSGRMKGLDLTDTGREQAATTAERLARLPIAAIYASPIERTMQTAEAIAGHHGLPVVPCEGVIEAEYGDWTDMALSECAKSPEWKVVQRTPSRAVFPNGESLYGMQARTVAAIEELVARHPGETIAIVSHADPIKSAIAHFTGLHLDLFQRLNVSPASVTVFDFHSFGVMMMKCNDTATLDEFVPKPPEPAPAVSTS